MPRMIDLVRKSQMSANMMHAAARGALAVQPGEMIEILVHLALHNKVFAETARMTLAGWDEKASTQVAADPITSKEVLEYLISPKNIRPALLPALLENRSIGEELLAELAASGSRTVVEAMLVSQRVNDSPILREALKTNPRLRANELAAIHQPRAAQAPAAAAETAMNAADQEIGAKPAEEAVVAAAEESSTPTLTDDALPMEGGAEDDELLAQAIAHYLEENAAELAAVQEKPFQAVKFAIEDTATARVADGQGAADQVPAAGTAAAKAPPASASKFAKKPGHPAGDDRRDSTLQKIAKLDIKGRIALAVRGGKEERSILIRDGTKLVALAVLDSPKITDGEVETFALQKNVLESVLRAIPMKRRFAKNYAVTRNLVFNPRTPLDLSLGLMKNLLVHDLKNLSGNKEVPETIRKLALRMFKQKTEKKKE